MSDEIKSGDMVQLSPGGSKMFLSQIENIAGVKKASCTWFEGTNKKDGEFLLTSLTPAP
jgi:uncharacterized protein YodC (DUF2158 family)